MGLRESRCKLRPEGVKVMDIKQGELCQKNHISQQAGVTEIVRAGMRFWNPENKNKVKAV